MEAIFDRREFLFVFFPQQTGRDLRRRSPSPSFKQIAEDSGPPADGYQPRKGSTASCATTTGVESEAAILTPNVGTVASNLSASGARGSGNHLHVPDGTSPVASDSENSDLLLANHLRVRRHRSLPSPTFNPEKLANFPHQQRSSSFRLPVKENKPSFLILNPALDFLESPGYCRTKRTMENQGEEN